MRECILVDIATIAQNEQAPANALFAVWVPGATEDDPGRVITMDLTTFSALVSSGTPLWVSALSRDVDTNEIVVMYQGGGASSEDRIDLPMPGDTLPSAVNDDVLIYENGSWRAEKVHGDNVASGTIQANNILIQDRAGGRLLAMNGENNSIEAVDGGLRFARLTFSNRSVLYRMVGETNNHEHAFIGPGTITSDDLEDAILRRLAPRGQNSDIGKILYARPDTFGRVIATYEDQAAPHFETLWTATLADYNAADSGSNRNQFNLPASVCAALVTRWGEFNALHFRVIDSSANVYPMDSDECVIHGLAIRTPIEKIEFKLQMSGVSTGVSHVHMRFDSSASAEASNTGGRVSFWTSDGPANISSWWDTAADPDVPPQIQLIGEGFG